MLNGIVAIVKQMNEKTTKQGGMSTPPKDDPSIEGIHEQTEEPPKQEGHQ